MITIASTFKLTDSLSFNSADMVMWTDNLNQTPFLFVFLPLSSPSSIITITITIIFHIVKEQGGTIRRNLSGVGTRLPHTFLSSPSPKSPSSSSSSSSSPSSSPPLPSSSPSSPLLKLRVHQVCHRHHPSLWSECRLMSALSHAHTPDLFVCQPLQSSSFQS